MEQPPRMAEPIGADADLVWPALPTETEIYILPNGEIVVADLPEELAAILTQMLPRATDHAAESVELHVTQQQYPPDPA